MNHDAEAIRNEALEEARTVLDSVGAQLQQARDLGDGAYWEGVSAMVEAGEVAIAALKTAQPSASADKDFWPVDGRASRKQLIEQIGRMNFQLKALRKENAGLVRRAKPQHAVSAEPEWVDDPHDIEQGMMRNPKYVAPVAAQSAPCDHIFEARRADGTRRANASVEAVCRECGYRPIPG
jgi:hypothetical protein